MEEGVGARVQPETGRRRKVPSLELRRENSPADISTSSFLGGWVGGVMVVNSIVLCQLVSKSHP